MRDMEPAAEAAAGVEHISDLGKAEGDGMVRPDGRPQNLSRIAMDAGRDIQAENRQAGRIDPFDHLPADAVDVAVETRPEKGVDDPVRVEERRPDGFDIRNR